MTTTLFTYRPLLYDNEPDKIQKELTNHMYFFMFQIILLHLHSTASNDGQQDFFL
jgi:hypothetical protein